MPRIAKNEPTKRLTLDMSERARERLEQLWKDTEADSLAEVVRKALAVYEFLMGAKRNGGKLVIKGVGEEPDREVVLL